jgi:hypothetical protein
VVSRPAPSGQQPRAVIISYRSVDISGGKRCARAAKVTGDCIQECMGLVPFCLWLPETLVTFRTGHTGYTFRFLQAGGVDTIESGHGRTPALQRRMFAGISPRNGARSGTLVPTHPAIRGPLLGCYRSNGRPRKHVHLASARKLARAALRAAAERSGPGWGSMVKSRASMIASVQPSGKRLVGPGHGGWLVCCWAPSNKASLFVGMSR